MRHFRVLIIPFVMLFVLACGLSGLTSGINQVKEVASQMPELLTSAPTSIGALETLVSTALPPSNCPDTPQEGGLGIALDRTKSLLGNTGMFTFTDGTVDGQPVSTATLTESGSSTFSAVANGFSAQFFGDPCNLTRILVKSPYTTDKNTIDQGLAATSSLFSTLLPIDVQFSLLVWLPDAYSKVTTSGQEKTTIGTMMFTLTKDQSNIMLEIVPAT
jgi:hypothetical protein